MKAKTLKKGLLALITAGAFALPNTSCATPQGTAGLGAAAGIAGTQAVDPRLGAALGAASTGAYVASQSQATAQSGPQVNVYNGNVSQRQVVNQTTKVYPDGIERSCIPATGDITKFWIEDNNNGLTIHTNFIINNNMGWKNALYGFFNDNHGNSLQSNNPEYSSKSGELRVFSGEIISPNQSNAETNFKMFIPYNEIKNQVGKNVVELELYLVDLSDGTNNPRTLDIEKRYFRFK